MNSTLPMADIVFCIDASGSMRPCIDGVRANVRQFLDGISSAAQMPWDLRFDFLAHQCSEEPGGEFVTGLYTTELANMRAIKSLYTQSGTGLFTTNVNTFSQALSTVPVEGDECTLMALDMCLDFPWRTASGCRRIVILLTDEPIESGAWLDKSRKLLPKVIDKIHQLKVMLFMMSPASDIMERLSAVDKAIWREVSTGEGLGEVDLAQVLQDISKSISKSQRPLGTIPEVSRALFGQDRWTEVEARPLSGR